MYEHEGKDWFRKGQVGYALIHSGLGKLGQFYTYSFAYHELHLSRCLLARSAVFGGGTTVLQQMLLV